MKINWIVRFKNKVWLASFLSMVLTFVYSILGMFDIYPQVTKNDVAEVINIVLMLLSTIGVINDPTTKGLSDSNRAMTYIEPHDDEKDPQIGNIIDDNHALVTETEGDADVDTDEPESVG